jgi:hypothetical protein
MVLSLAGRRRRDADVILTGITMSRIERDVDRANASFGNLTHALETVATWADEAWTPYISGISNRSNPSHANSMAPCAPSGARTARFRHAVLSEWTKCGEAA